MLLRRITEHVKAQNWTAVFLDFVIVVVGVFIGIQVANWNEAQKDRALEQDILARLHTELMAREQEHARVANDELQVRQRLYDARLVLLGIVELRQLVAEECAALSRSGATLLPEVGVAIVDELISTGRLDLIRNAKIRSGISALHQLQSSRETSFETYLSSGVNLSRQYPNLLPYSLVPATDPEDEDGYSPAFECDAFELVNDRAFLNDLAQNVSNYATAGNVIRANTEVIQNFHKELDEYLGLTH